MFVKGYGILSFAKNMSKNIGKDISKSLNGKYSPGMLTMREKLLHHAKQSATDVFKTPSKREMLIKLRRFKKIHNKIIQKQLKMSRIKKYLKKDIYLQNKDKKLLMN